MWKWPLGRGWPDLQEKWKHMELLNVKQVQETDPESQTSYHYCTGRIKFDKFIYSCCTLCSVRAQPYGRKEDEVEVVLLWVCLRVRGTGMTWAAISPHLGMCGNKISTSLELWFDIPQRLGVFQVISQQEKFEIHFQLTGVYGMLSMHWTAAQALPVRSFSLWAPCTSGDASSPAVA